MFVKRYKVKMLHSTVNYRLLWGFRGALECLWLRGIRDLLKEAILEQCFGYLLLQNQPSQSLVAWNNNHHLSPTILEVDWVVLLLHVVLGWILNHLEGPQWLYSHPGRLMLTVSWRSAKAVSPGLSSPPGLLKWPCWTSRSVVTGFQKGKAGFANLS